VLGIQLAIGCADITCTHAFAWEQEFMEMPRCSAHTSGKKSATIPYKLRITIAFYRAYYLVQNKGTAASSSLTLLNHEVGRVAAIAL